ncbi:hypothetical protein ACLOJK_005731 [Asimina triloba]
MTITFTLRARAGEEDVEGGDNEGGEVVEISGAIGNHQCRKAETDRLEKRAGRGDEKRSLGQGQIGKAEGGRSSRQGREEEQGEGRGEEEEERGGEGERRGRRGRSVRVGRGDYERSLGQGKGRGEGEGREREGRCQSRRRGRRGERAGVGEDDGERGGERERRGEKMSEGRAEGEERGGREKDGVGVGEEVEEENVLQSEKTIGMEEDDRSLLPVRERMRGRRQESRVREGEPADC